MNNNNHQTNTEISPSPRPKAVFSAVAAAAIVILSLLSALGLGGLPLISLAGVAFAYLICTHKNLLPAAVLPLAFLGAFAVSGDLAVSFAALLFVPVGAALAYTTLTKRTLTVTVTVTCVFVLIAFGAYFAVSVTDIYGEGLRESLAAFGRDAESAVREVLSLFQYEDPSGKEIFSLADEDISFLIDTVVMLLPSVCVVTCQLTAYGAARLLQLFCRLSGHGSYYERPYTVTVSAAAGAIYIIAYMISFLSREASVLSYAALNLTYILMPVCAAAGFHYLFSKGGIFRGHIPRSTKTIIIITCGFCILMSPFSFIPLLSVFGSTGAIGRSFGEFVRSRRNKNGDS